MVGRKQLICPWDGFEERIHELFEIGREYQALIARVRWRLREAGITDAEVLPHGSWTLFEPDKVSIRMRGKAGLVLGRDVGVPHRLEFSALQMLKMRPALGRRITRA